MPHATRRTNKNRNQSTTPNKSQVLRAKFLQPQRAVSPECGAGREGAMRRLGAPSWVRANTPHAFLCAAVRCQSVAVNELSFSFLPASSRSSFSLLFWGLLGCSTMTIRTMASSALGSSRAAAAASVLYRHFLSFWFCRFPCSQSINEQIA